MATESVVSPVMMNRPIVDPKTGSLTQYGYSLFSKLLMRTGGTVGTVVDVDDLENQITQASMFPIEQPRQPTQESPADIMQFAPADMTVFPEPMQSDIGPDAFALDMTWQRI